MKLLDRLYCYIWRGWENNANTYLIDDRMRALIDPGHRRFLNHLLRSMGEEGFGLRDIDLIINTHSHPDHCEANVDFIQKGGAKAAMHKLEEEYLRNEGYVFFTMMDIDPEDFVIHFHLGEELKLDGVSLKIIHTPGHTPGGVSLYWPEEEVLVSGDLIFEGSVGRTDLAGGDREHLKESIENVSKLKVKYLLPGHGEIVMGRKKVEDNFKLVKSVYFAWI